MIIVKPEKNFIRYVSNSKEELIRHYTSLLCSAPDEGDIITQYDKMYAYLIPIDINDALQEASKCLRNARQVMSSTDAKTCTQAEQLVQELNMCITQPGATISVTIEHPCRPTLVTKLCDHPIFVSDLINALKRLEGEL